MGALREAFTNAVMHRNWFTEGANVFVELYTDRIEVSSPGGLPKGMTLADLGRKSVRRNALLADLLHRITFIEKAGTGIKRIQDEVRARGCPERVFENTGFFTATFFPDPWVRAQAEAQATAEVTGQVHPKYPPSTPHVTPQVHAVLAAAMDPATRDELMQAAGVRDRKHFRLAYVDALIGAGWLEMTIPKRPRSPKQRYRITSLGREILKPGQEKE
jgi:ATP-dependent DNA helicase RecG